MKNTHQVQNNIYSNLCVRSKQPRRIKAIIYNDIFTSFRRKNVQSPKVQGIVQSVRESLSMKRNRRLRGLTMFVFNFGVESLEQSVNLGRLVIFDFLGNSLL